MVFLYEMKETEIIMEITSRQRAKLKGIASNYDTIFQIGKNAISDELIKQLSDALEARELIKIRVLQAR